MRILLNGLPLLTPLSGVGRYVHSTAGAMRLLAPEDKFFFFYNGYWSSHLKGRPSPTALAARKLGRRFGPIYAASRFALEATFQITHRFGRFDLYHETCYVPFIFNGPTVVTVFDLSFHHFPGTHPPERLRFLKDFFYARLSRATHFITLSEFVRDEMVKHLGLSPSKISVTYPGVDDVFRPHRPEDMGGLRTRFGVEPGKYLLFVGNMEPRKNISLLFQSYARLPRPLRQKYPLVLAGGSGWMQQGLSDQMVQLGISEDVKRVGYVTVEDLPILFSGATMFIYPSIYEGFGLPPVEAMASGCPTIVSRAGSLPEVVGDAAALVDPYNPDDLFRTLQSLIEDPGRRESMREAGIRWAQKYRWEHCARATLDVYRRAVKG